MLKHNNFVITESQHRMLTESAAERFVDRLITNNLPENARQYADTTIGELVKSHPDILSRLPLDTSDEVLERFGNTKLKDFIRISIMQLFDMHGNAGSGKGPVKYMRGIFRIALDELKLLQRPDMNSINRLKDNVLYIMNAANDGDAECLAVDSDLNGMSEEQLDRTFRDKRKAFFTALRARMSGKKVGKAAHKYTKVPILRHEDAERFRPYTGWCIAFENSSNYDSYTNGGRRFYVFLRDDYKDFGKEGAPRGENCPLDDYGLSMVSVLVNTDGHIDIITTRWNHANDGEFNPPDEETLDTIQREMGVNLYAECPPYSREELRKMGIIPFDEIQAELDRGVSPENIFKEIKDAEKGFSIVYVNGKYSFLNNETNKLIGDGNIWYRHVDSIFEGYAKVQREDGKWSIIDRNCRLIGNGNQWYKEVGFFFEGYVRVQREDGKWSFIDTDGELIGDGNVWYFRVDHFNRGYASVQREDYKWSFIDKNGKLIGDGNVWYERVGGFKGGYSTVQREDDKWSFIDKDGKLIGNGNKWYRGVCNFLGGCARVLRKDKEWFYLSKMGNEFASEKEARADSERYGMAEARNRRTKPTISEKKSIYKKNIMYFSKIISEALEEYKDQDRNITFDNLEDFTSTIPRGTFVHVGMVSSVEITKRRKPQVSDVETLNSELETQRMSTEKSNIDAFLGNSIQLADDFANGVGMTGKKSDRKTMDLSLSDRFSIVKYSEYEMNFMDHRDVARHYDKWREAEWALRKEFGFGPELDPEDESDWRNRKEEKTLRDANGKIVKDEFGKPVKILKSKYGGPSIQKEKDHGDNAYNQKDNDSKLNFWTDKFGNRSLRQKARKIGSKSVYVLFDNETGTGEVLSKSLLYFLRDKFGKETINAAIEEVNNEAQTEEERFNARMAEIASETRKVVNLLEKNILFISFSDKNSNGQRFKKRQVNRPVFEKYKKIIPLFNLGGRIDNVDGGMTTTEEISGIAESYTNYSKPENTLIEAKSLIRRMDNML